MPLLPPTAARPLQFIGYPGPSTRERKRIPQPMPECPKCSSKFNHLHCTTCFDLWCPGCKVILRPDTGIWFAVGSDEGGRVKPIDVERIVEKSQRLDGNWDGKTAILPGDCVAVLPGLVHCENEKCAEGGNPWRSHWHREAVKK